LPSSSIVLILKSMPIVVMKDGVKESSLNRNRQHDLPTPESPMRRSLIYLKIGRISICGSLVTLCRGMHCVVVDCVVDTIAM
jgi:hypothetical protein